LRETWKRTSIWHLLVFGLFAGLTTGCGGGQGSVPSPDRVVLVTIDTLRADHVGSYGAKRAHTPNFDTVAATGVRFENAIAPTPLTLPSHASLMTACDPPAHGVRHNATYRLGDGIPTLAEHLRSAGFATAAFVGAFVLDGRFGLDRGFDVYDDRMEGRRSAQVGFAERTADEVVDAALRWLQGAPPRFFLWVHFYDPHAGYAPPPGFASAFASHLYAGEIAFVDAQLGRLLGEIEGRWPAGRTLVAVTSDHGESLGEHGEETHSYSIYDATQRVPLVLRGPGLPGGRVVPSQVRLVDVAPTLLAAAGAAPLPGVDGRDLRPLIEDRDPTERIAYLETLATRLDYGWSPLFGLRDGRFKYIRAPRPELYDLQSDPSELRNLATTEPDVTARLDGLLAQRLAALADRPATGGEVVLEAADRRRLRQLGYVVADSHGQRSVSLDVSGPDPKDEVGVLGVMADAQREAAAGDVDTALGRLASVRSAGVAVPLLRSSIAVAAKRYRLAERDARFVVARQPERSDAWVILGRALAGQGRLTQARRALERGVELDPHDALAHTLLGLVHETMRSPRAAETCYARARQADSQGTEATLRLGALLLERGAFAEADAVLAELPDDASLEPEAAARLAAAANAAGRPEMAKRVLEGAGKTSLADSLPTPPSAPDSSPAPATR